MENRYSRSQAEVRPEGGRSILERCKRLLSRVALRVVLGERKVLCERCRRPLGEVALRREAANQEKKHRESDRDEREMTLKDALKVPSDQRVLVFRNVRRKTREEQEAWIKEVSDDTMTLARA